MIPYADPSDRINDLIDEAIKSLADDDIKQGAEALVELATSFAKAGLPQETFQNMRTHIINEATKKTDAVFIAEKLKLIEQEMREDRKIIVH